uniref:Si:ch211-244b2.4 n=1 Tax=Gouania willdenowi TaxID=441366 RepID=A0A8C5GXL1_GOUWI
SEDVSDSSSESSLDREISFQQACRYYNSGGCKNGANCQYLHVCKFALKGNCRYGAKCKFNHDVKALSSRDPKLTDGRLYQWQLDDGKGWKDIDNDDVIEAQYSLPHTKSIKIYNTQYGAVSISFRNVTVVDKKLSVRRLSDGNSSWVWYCMLHHKWIKYGEKGKASPVSSSDIEKKFQNNPASSITFDIGGETYEIRFTGDRHSHHNTEEGCVQLFEKPNPAFLHMWQHTHTHTHTTTTDLMKQQRWRVWSSPMKSWHF